MCGSRKHEAQPDCHSRIRPGVAGDAIIRHLLTRGTHRQYGYAALTVMLSLYFVGAAWIAGSAVSSGVFVPMLVIGSLIGRLLGLAAVDMAATFGRGSAG